MVHLKKVDKNIKKLMIVKKKISVTLAEHKNIIFIYIFYKSNDDMHYTIAYLNNNFFSLDFAIKYNRIKVFPSHMNNSTRFINKLDHKICSF